MSPIARALKALPLAGAMLLASCGGGSGDSTPDNQHAGPGIEIPATPAPSVALFIARAQQANCADLSNRLYIIDQKYAFTAVTGKCGDASYAYELFGATPDIRLCSKADSIAGPQMSCSDDKVKALFETIVANLDKADLGLGSAHKVEAISIPLKDGQLVFESIAANAFSSVHSERKVVVKDANAFAALWAEHTAGRTGQPVTPVVDFRAKMVLAAFGGQKNVCRDFGIRRVGVSGGKIVAALEDRDVSAATLCVAAVTAPMQMVVVDRSDAAVEFAAFSQERLPFRELDNEPRTILTSKMQVVIKDAMNWEQLWKAHRPGDAAPAVDFGKQMVVAVFIGDRSNGCYGARIDGIFRAAGKLNVNVVEQLAKRGNICPQAFVQPYAMVVLDRSDEPVEFWQQAFRSH